MKNIKYILMVLLGGTMYGTMSSFVKMSFADGYNAAELSFWQAFLSAAILSVCTLFTHRHSEKELRWSKCLPLFLTGGAIGMVNFLYYESVEFISASLAVIILMQFTWLSMLIEWLLFSNKPSCPETITVIFILIGTIMAGGLCNGKPFTLSLKGLALAVGSSLAYAIYIVANGRIGTDVKWQSKSMMIMIGSSTCIFSINCTTVLSCNYMNPEFMLWALFLSVVGTTVPTALFAAGISKIGAGRSAILMTVELPVAIICAHIILAEHISSVQGLGVGIMLSAICAMNYYKHRKGVTE